MATKLTRPNNFERELDQFFARRTCTDINREKFIPFALRDNANKLTTCLMFNCNCHSYEDPVNIECEYTGAVIHLPAFWVEVPKELAMTYVLGIIDSLYESTYTQWAIDGKIGQMGGGDGNTGNSGCGCGCTAMTGWN